MVNDYEEMKDHYGLTAEDEDDHEEVANNNFFRKMHPNFTLNISDVLKDPALSLEKFKANYLGIKKKRNPIIKNFNSSMIKTIHELSPRWKRAALHDFVPTPKQTVSTFGYTPQTSHLSTPRKQSAPKDSFAARKLYQTL